MTMKFNAPEEATPLEPEDIFDLIPTHITTHEQLNAWEQKNIISAQKWARKEKDILSVSFIQLLHKQMFNETWKWAGKFRQSGKNIGVDWPIISVELKKLCDDVAYQLQHKIFPVDEIAIRFHYRLVWIHPFPNGNGRHARLMADLLIMQQGRPRFSWGMGQDLYKATPIRKQYINALRQADQGDYSKLIDFART
jgi:Fic-DOC domain mobile mystery protein B